MISYYDYVLGLIPTVFLGVTGLTTLTGLSLTTAVPLGGLCAIALIGHALFINNPVAPSASSPSAQSTPDSSRSSGFSAADD